MEVQDRQLKEEEDFLAFVREFQADAVVADLNFKKLLRDFEGTFIDYPHFAVSGRLLES